MIFWDRTSLLVLIAGRLALSGDFEESAIVSSPQVFQAGATYAHGMLTSESYCERGSG